MPTIIVDTSWNGYSSIIGKWTYLLRAETVSRTMCLYKPKFLWLKQPKCQKDILIKKNKFSDRRMEVKPSD